MVHRMEKGKGCGMVHKKNEEYRAWGLLKSVPCKRGLGIRAKKCLYEGLIVPTALYGAEDGGWEVLREGK